MPRKLFLLGTIATILIALFPGVHQGLQVAQAAREKPIAQLVRAINMSDQGVTWDVALAVDRNWNIYVSDASPDNPRILKYDKQGRFLLEWGGLGSAPGKFKFWPDNPDEGPNAGFIAVDSQGYVYVSDSYNYRIQKFDPHGKLLMQWGEPGTGPDQFEGGPGPIHIDKHDHVWVSTFPRVQEFDTQGQFLATFGTGGTEDGQFMGAALGAVDNQGNMYIADALNSRVQKLDANGNFILAWGTPGTEPGQFAWPVGIVLDDKGGLYISDNTNRV